MPFITTNIEDVAIGFAVTAIVFLIAAAYLMWKVRRLERRDSRRTAIFKRLS